MRSRLMLLLLLFFFPTLAKAIDPSMRMTQYVHRAWHTEEGLPQISAMCLAQTPDGYLWIGTSNGLARFDGVRFTVFTQANTPQLWDNAITALLVDRGGTLWIGTPHGVNLFRRGGFEALGPRQGFPLSAVY